MRTRRRRSHSTSSSGKEVEVTAGASRLLERDNEGSLTAVSRDAVTRLVKRVKSRSLSPLNKQDDYLHRCDSVGETESTVNDVNETGLSDDLGKGKDIMQANTVSEEEQDDESIWEDGSLPTSSSVNNQTHVTNGMTIELEETGTPESGKRKTVRRASAEEKELAELVHKVHLLCLIGRGRLIDSACNDLLIQASLLSILPCHLSRFSEAKNLRVSDLNRLAHWFHDSFRIRNPGNSGRSLPAALTLALGNREGTSEEVTALSVALFRALNLTARFVSILDVASLKPDTDRPESVGRDSSKACKDIFQSSTLMVARPNKNPLSPIKVSLLDEKENTVEQKSRDSPRAKRSKLCSQNSQLGQNLEDNSSDLCLTRKSGGSKRKGDLEFEMQLEMALAATSVKNLGNTNVLPNNSENSPRLAKKLKTIKAVEASSSQGISTAYGSSKVGAPLYWAEVYCSEENSTGKWVHIDVVNNIVDGEQKVEAAAAACKTSLRYVMAFAGLGAKDVTRRYCSKWYKIASQRIDPGWWNATLAPLKELESHATAGMTPFTQNNSNGQVKEEANTLPEESIGDLSATSSAQNPFVATRSSLEDMELETRALTEPLPTNQQAYKNHHLYALERWLTKYQILHPKGPILGFCSGHPVYPRTCVQILHTKIRWLREGLQVKASELPTKVLKNSPKARKEPAYEADGEIQEEVEKNVELFGNWQTEPLCLPHAVNGIVPKNERGHVDVWSEKCLPPGTVHLRLPRVAFVAKRLEIDFAHAMVGFEFRKGGAVPVFEGIVVCTEFKDSILEAYVEEEERRQAAEKKRNEAQAMTRWYQLLSSIVTRQRLNDLYGSGSVSNTSNVTPETKHMRKDNTHFSRSEEQNLLDKKDDVSTAVAEEHEHVFLNIDRDYKEETFTRTRRCQCGFSIQVEEL